MKTCEETACADTSGELEQKELKEKYLIARTLLKVSLFHSLAPFGVTQLSSATTQIIFLGANSDI